MKIVHSLLFCSLLFQFCWSADVTDLPESSLEQLPYRDVHFAKAASALDTVGEIVMGSIKCGTKGLEYISRPSDKNYENFRKCSENEIGKKVGRLIGGLFHLSKSSANGLKRLVDFIGELSLSVIKGIPVV